MMITREDAEPLIGYRVSARIGQYDTIGVLRAVTPTDRLIIADDRGMETLAELDDVSGLQDARLACSKCGRQVNRVFSDEGRCADCERVYAGTQPAPREICEICSAEGAVYSPKIKKFGCIQCLAKAGGLTGIGAEARALTHSSRVAVCRSDDIDSLRHDWKRSKSSYHCKLCYVKTFTKPAGYRYS